MDSSKNSVYLFLKSSRIITNALALENHFDIILFKCYLVLYTNSLILEITLKAGFKFFHFFFNTLKDLQTSFLMFVYKKYFKHILFADSFI